MMHTEPSQQPFLVYPIQSHPTGRMVSEKEEKGISEDTTREGDADCFTRIIPEWPALS